MKDYIRISVETMGGLWLLHLAPPLLGILLWSPAHTPQPSLAPSPEVPPQPTSHVSFPKAFPVHLSCLFSWGACLPATHTSSPSPPRASPHTHLAGHSHALLHTHPKTPMGAEQRWWPRGRGLAGLGLQGRGWTGPQPRCPFSSGALQRWWAGFLGNLSLSWPLLASYTHHPWLRHKFYIYTYICVFI